MRRRDSATLHPGIRHPRPSAGRQGHLRAHGLALGAGTSTCRSTAASSAWWTATCSTNGCASAPPAPAPCAAPAPSSGSSAATTASPQVLYQPKRPPRDAAPERVRARAVIGADGALSQVARQRRSGRRPGALRVRLSRNHPLAARRRFRSGALRRLLQRRDVARFLQLDLPARRHHQRRHRQRPQGVLAARRGRRSCAKWPGWTGRKPSAAKARPFRCGR